jgi:uncharacterized protein (DUF1778 family)
LLNAACERADKVIEVNRAAVPNADHAQWTSPETIAEHILQLLYGERTGERIEL